MATVKVLDFGLAKAMEPIRDVSPSSSMSSPTITSPVLTQAGRDPRDRSVHESGASARVRQSTSAPTSGRSAACSTRCSRGGGLSRERPCRTSSPRFSIANQTGAALPDGLPPSVVTLLKRCLDRNSKRRLRDIGDARIEIDDAITKPDGRGTPASESARITWRRWIAPACRRGRGTGGAVVGFGASPLEEAWVNPLANAQFTRFTDFPGTETLAAISPDGRFVAFLSDQDGPFNLWLSQVDTGRFANLTKDLPPLAFNLNVRQMGFSGDGAEVSFLTGGRRVLMPLIGGMPRPFLDRRRSSRPGRPMARNWST